MFPAVLTESQQALLESLSGIAEVRTFYLAGGTALALYLGHRRSRDFDLFRQRDFNPPDLLSVLRPLGELAVLREAGGTLTVVAREIPVSFFAYDYPLLRPLHESPWGVLVADPADIAAMKLAALAGRGSRKDFVDLYFYAREVAPLEETFVDFRRKYQGISVDPYHLLRSLAFFDDAEAEAMLELLVPVDWEAIRSFFRTEAARLFRVL